MHHDNVAADYVTLLAVPHHLKNNASCFKRGFVLILPTYGSNGRMRNGEEIGKLMNGESVKH